MTELDAKWEDQIKALAKTDPIKAHEQTQKIICGEICDRKDCEQKCAFLRRVVKYILVQETLKSRK